MGHVYDESGSGTGGGGLGLGRVCVGRIDWLRDGVECLEFGSEMMLISALELELRVDVCPEVAGGVRNAMGGWECPRSTALVVAVAIGGVSKRRRFPLRILSRISSTCDFICCASCVASDIDTVSSPSPTAEPEPEPCSLSPVPAPLVLPLSELTPTPTLALPPGSPRDTPNSEFEGLPTDPDPDPLERVRKSVPPSRE